MGTKTGIEWTDATWNPIRGCSRVSEGCRNCYAESVAHRFNSPGMAYEGLVQLDHFGKSNGKWNGQIRFVEEHLLDPLRWKPIFLTCEVCGVRQYQCLCEKFNHRPRRIFVNSMSDLFHENVTDEMLDRIFAVMALCPQHTFQVLTKRPERMLAYLSEAGRRSEIGQRAADLAFDLQSLKKYARILKPSNATDVVYDCGPGGDEVGCRVHMPWPMPNVWLGVSVEDQKAADARLMYVHRMAADGWQTMVSFEPLLGAVTPHPAWLSLGPRTWAIIGGESGHGARPMHPGWARELRDQCVAAGVPFFFKQWGELAPGAQGAQYGDKKQACRIDLQGKPVTSPQQYAATDALFYPLGKKAAGDLLDGQQWHQFPEVRHG